MVTGDYHHTALAVAKGVGMVPPEMPLVIIQSQTEFRIIRSSSVAMPSALKSPKGSTAPSRRGVSFRIKEQPDKIEEPQEGQLRFQLDNGDAFQGGDALRAFTSIAQVRPCPPSPPPSPPICPVPSSLLRSSIAGIRSTRTLDQQHCCKSGKFIERVKQQAIACSAVLLSLHFLVISSPLGYLLGS